MGVFLDMQAVLLGIFSKKRTSKMAKSPMHKLTYNDEKLEVNPMLKEEHNKSGHTLITMFFPK